MTGDLRTPAEKQADYVAGRSWQREVLMHYLATRELPGSPVTAVPHNPLLPSETDASLARMLGGGAP